MFILIVITEFESTFFDSKTRFFFSRKNRERRENVISELVVTEREFCRDLKLTWQAFGLDTPAMLEQRGLMLISICSEKLGHFTDIQISFL